MSDDPKQSPQCHPDDHDWIYIDDSFDHAFGTEICGHWECKNCEAEDDEREPPSFEDYCFD